MRNILKIAAPIVVLAGAAGIVWVLGATKAAPVKNEEKPRPVSLYVDPVRAENVRLTIRTQGEVRPKTEIDLVPQVSGRIIAMSDAFAAGAGFQPGETLIKIEDADYRLAVASAEARVAEANVNLEKQLADARIKRKQWQDWVKDGQPTPLALNQPQVAEAQAKLRAAQADLDNAKLNLSRTEIKLPYSGRVRERDVSVGQYVSVGTKLGRVFATDTVEIRLPLTDEQLTELALPIGFVAKAGDAPVVKLTSNMGGQPHEWTGHIVRTHAAIDQQTRLIYAVAQVDDPYGAGAHQGMPLAVGLYVNAEVEGVIPQHAYVMPRDALRKEDKVYLIKDGKLQIHTVDVMSTSSHLLYVRDGVRDGDQVVTAPVQAVYDGMPAEPIVRTAKSGTPDADAVEAAAARTDDSPSR